MPTYLLCQRIPISLTFGLKTQSRTEAEIVIINSIILMLINIFKILYFKILKNTVKNLSRKMSPPNSNLELLSLSKICFNNYIINYIIL